MQPIAHEFTERMVSPWGGIKYFHSVYRSSGLRDFLSSLPLPEPGSNRGYKAIDLIEGFLASVVLGSRRLEHCGMLRTDAVIKEIFNWKKGMASASTFSRFFQRFDSETNDKLFPAIMKFIFSKITSKYLTIDIDSTVITRYGKQEGSAVGYNPHNHGGYSHHPILAFCDELKMVINGWMRAGNTDSKTGILPFLQELFTIIEPARVGLIRADVGFYSQSIMHYLEELPEPVKYLIKARCTASMISKIASQEEWLRNDDVIDGAIYAESTYQGQKWTKERRLILVGVPKKFQSKKSKRRSELFKEYEVLDEYEFYGFVTNSDLSMVEAHRRYNQRGDAENRIKELKYDYAMDGFVMNKLKSTEAAFRFVFVAFNIMAIFKQMVMKSTVNHRLSTIRFQCIAIGSYLVETGRKKILKLAAAGKRRHFLEHLFENVEKIRPPYRFSNA